MKDDSLLDLITNIYDSSSSTKNDLNAYTIPQKSTKRSSLSTTKSNTINTPSLDLLSYSSMDSLASSSCLNFSKVDVTKLNSIDYNLYLTSVLDTLKIKGLSIDFALRKLLALITLPLEAQLIDSVINRFSNSYAIKNNYYKKELVYIISFSILLLNTNLNNSKVKTKMSLKQYLNQICSLDIGKEIESICIEVIYSNVSKYPFKKIDRINSNPFALDTKGLKECTQIKYDAKYRKPNHYFMEENKNYLKMFKIDVMEKIVINNKMYSTISNARKGINCLLNTCNRSQANNMYVKYGSVERSTNTNGIIFMRKKTKCIMVVSDLILLYRDCSFINEQIQNGDVITTSPLLAIPLNNTVAFTSNTSDEANTIDIINNNKIYSIKCCSTNSAKDWIDCINVLSVYKTLDIIPYQSSLKILGVNDHQLRKKIKINALQMERDIEDLNSKIIKQTSVIDQIEILIPLDRKLRSKCLNILSALQNNLQTLRIDFLRNTIYSNILKYDIANKK